MSNIEHDDTNKLIINKLVVLQSHGFAVDSREFFVGHFCPYGIKYNFLCNYMYC